MANEAHCLFGEVLKTFGTGGELLVKVAEWVLQSDESIKEPLFVEIDGLLVPFYFKLFELKGKKAKVIFENMELESLAEELKGKKIFSSRPSNAHKNKSGLSEFIGFTVNDLKHGNLGVVVEVFEFPGNPCVDIETSQGKFLIPLNGAIQIDERNRLIITEIPDGLLTVNS